MPFGQSKAISGTTSQSLWFYVSSIACSIDILGVDEILNLFFRNKQKSAQLWMVRLLRLVLKWSRCRRWDQSIWTITSLIKTYHSNSTNSNNSRCTNTSKCCQIYLNVTWIADLPPLPVSKRKCKNASVYANCAHYFLQRFDFFCISVINCFQLFHCSGRKLQRYRLCRQLQRGGKTVFIKIKTQERKKTVSNEKSENQKI